MQKLDMKKDQSTKKLTKNGPWTILFRSKRGKGRKRRGEMQSSTSPPVGIATSGGFMLVRPFVL